MAVFHSPLACLLSTLKTQCGVTQVKVAKDLDVSPQALADMKAGRRRFTADLAEKLLQVNAKEPWAGWLAEELARILQSLPGAEYFRVADPVVPGKPSPRFSAKPTELIPLLSAPFQGAPETSPTYGEDTELPAWAAKLMGGSGGAYALELASDDYAGRLRAGDQLLIIQKALSDKEIMIVECPRGLRVARNSAFAATAEIPAGQWIALDSGESIADATPIATAVAILMAKL